MWHYGAIVLGVCVCRSDDHLICFGSKPKQRDWARDLPRDQKWTRRGRSQKGQKVNWRRKTERGSWQQSAEGSRRRWKQDREGSQQKSERQLLRPDDLQRGWVNQRKMSAWLVAFVEVSRKIHAGDSLQMHGECKVSQNSLSCAWNWPKSILFVCSSFHPLGCIFCGRKEKWNTPAETTGWITGYE